MKKIILFLTFLFIPKIATGIENAIIERRNVEQFAKSLLMNIRNVYNENMVMDNATTLDFNNVIAYGQNTLNDVENYRIMLENNRSVFKRATSDFARLSLLWQLLKSSGYLIYKISHMPNNRLLHVPYLTLKIIFILKMFEFCCNKLLYFELKEHIIGYAVIVSSAILASYMHQPTQVLNKFDDFVIAKINHLRLLYKFSKMIKTTGIYRDKDGEITDCSICLSANNDQSVTLLCDHQFHRNCIFDWLMRKSNCPMCRHNL